MQCRRSLARDTLFTGSSFVRREKCFAAKLGYGKPAAAPLARELASDDVITTSAPRRVPVCRQINLAEQTHWDVLRGTAAASPALPPSSPPPCRTRAPPPASDANTSCSRAQVASYEFTTLTCIPGVIRYRGAKIQLLDLPGIIEGAKDGKGRGRQARAGAPLWRRAPPGCGSSYGGCLCHSGPALTQNHAFFASLVSSSPLAAQVISTARTCNLILIVLDALKPITHKRLIEYELEGFGIRLNKEPPKITFKRKDKGGISFSSTVTPTHLDLETVTQVCKEYKIHNADIRMQGDYTDEELIDVIEGNRIYCPAIYVLNKIDQVTLEELNLLDRMPHYCPISAHLVRGARVPERETCTRTPLFSSAVLLRCACSRPPVSMRVMLIRAPGSADVSVSVSARSGTSTDCWRWRGSTWTSSGFTPSPRG